MFFRDDDLKMFRLQRMDHDFFIQRAEWKTSRNRKMEDIRNGQSVQRDPGEQAEISFAQIVGPTSVIPEQYRSTTLF